MRAHLSRREALGLLGGCVLAACGGGGGAKQSTATSSRTATTTSSTPSGPPPSSTTTTTNTTTTTTTTTPVVAGSNKNITHQVLVDDAKGYNGKWTAAWTVDTFGTHGTFSGVSRIDPDARTLSVDVSVEGDLFHDGVPVAPVTLSGSADSYTYADDGTFAIHKQTPIGDATIISGRGIGSGEFRLHLASPSGHPGVTSFDAQGVANRGGVIPITFTIGYTDGSKATGSCRFTH
jgi:hypothetical protein